MLITRRELGSVWREMRISRRAFARLSGYAESSLRQMEDGVRPIPRKLAVWTDGLMWWLLENPRPGSRDRD